MKAANRISSSVKAIIFGVLVATFLFAPLGVAPVSADGGSFGQPGTPPADSTADQSIVIVQPDLATEPVVTTIQYMSLFLFTGI